MNCLSKFLKIHRLNKKWSLKGVARDAGLTEGYICMIENGKRHPSLTALHKIAKGYEVNFKPLAKLYLQE